VQRGIGSGWKKFRELAGALCAKDAGVEMRRALYKTCVRLRQYGERELVSEEGRGETTSGDGEKNAAMDSGG
jgi:hypothetical protein